MVKSKAASLRSEIEAWDMKSKGFIVDIFERHHGRAEFLTGIVGMMNDEPMQRGATWLLKCYFDAGGKAPDERTVKAIYAKAPVLVHWEAKLHVLQCIEHLPIPGSQLQNVETFLRACLDDEAKLVRAWAYSGFHELAVQYPGYQPEASEILARALATETAGSVLARIRCKAGQGFA